MTTLYEGLRRRGMSLTNVATAADIIDELINYEKEQDGNLPIMQSDRWVFLFAKDLLIILGKGHQRVVLSARNLEVMMMYSVI